MAAWTNAAGGSYHRSSFGVRPAVVRLAAALFAGGVVLLLWGGSADAQTAADPAPAPAPTASSDGLLNGLLGAGGALTPVVELVDGVAQPLTGSTPVGTTVSTVVTTVDPVVAPVVAPVAPVTDPIVTPLLDTVADVTEGVTTTLTNPLPTPTVPGVPGTPTTPTDPTTPTGPGAPPVVDPGTASGELPPLLPPFPGVEDGSSPVVPGPVSGGSVPGGPLSLPMAVAAGPAGSTSLAVRAGDRVVPGTQDGPGHGTTSASGSAERGSLARSADRAVGDDAHGGARSHRGHGPFGPVAPAPAPCAGGTLSGPGSSLVPAPAWHGGAGHFGPSSAAHAISVPSVSRPVPAPCAGPEVSPD